MRSKHHVALFATIALLTNSSAHASPKLVPQLGLRAAPESTALSDDGKWLVTIGHNVVELWNVDKCAIIRTDTRPSSHAAISPDGNTIAVTFSDNGSSSGSAPVTLYDRVSWQIKRTLPADGATELLRFSPDGNLLLTGGFQSIQLWNSKTGRRLWSRRTAGDARLIIVSYSADGSTVATGKDDGFGSWELEFWRTSDGALVDTMAFPHQIHTAAFSPDGKSLAVGAGDWPGGGLNVEVWDLKAKKLKSTIGSAAMNITSIAYSPDGRAIVAGDETGTFRRWDAATGKEVVKAGGGGFVNPAHVTDRGEYVVAPREDGAISVYNAVSGKLRRSIPHNPSSRHGIAFSSDGRTLYTAGTMTFSRSSSAGETVGWDMQTGQVSSRTIFQATAADEILPVGLGRQAVVNDGQGCITVVDTLTGTARILVQYPQPWRIAKVALSANGEFVAVASTRDKRPPTSGVYSGPPPESVGQVDVFKTVGPLVTKIENIDGECLTLGFSPDNRFLQSITDQRGVDREDWNKPRTVSVLHAWSLNGKLDQSRKLGFSAFMYSQSPSPDGKFLVTDTGVYDASGKLLFSIGERGTSIGTAVFSADSRRFAASVNGNVCVWDMAIAQRSSAKIRKPIASVPGGATAYNTKIALSPAGDRIAVMDDGESLNVYNVDTQKPLAQLLSFGLARGSSLDFGWLTVTPDGYFDGDAAGRSVVTWAQNGSTVRSARLMGKYYQPDRVQIAMTGHTSKSTYTNLVHGQAVLGAKLQRQVRPFLTQAAGNAPAPRPKDINARLIYDMNNFNCECLSQEDAAARVKEDIATGADPNIRTQYWSALSFAAAFGDVDEVRQLLAHGARVKDGPKDVQPPLISAAYWGHEDIVDVLLAAGADYAYSDGTSLTTMSGNSSALGKALLDTLAPEHLKSNKGNPIGQAMLLIHQGADLTMRNDKGQTAMILAAAWDPELIVVNALAKHGGDVNAKDNEGLTALSAAVDNYEYPLAAKLLSLGADPNVFTKDGDTVLIAIAARAPTFVPLLLDHGASPNIAGKSQYGASTALYSALQSGSHSAVKSLLDHGASITTDPSDESLIEIAIGNNDATMVKMLIDHGARVDTKDRDGKTLIEDAAQSDPDGEFGIAQLLRAAGENR